jgi:hypothetical protein
VYPSHPLGAAKGHGLVAMSMSPLFRGHVFRIAQSLLRDVKGTSRDEVVFIWGLSSCSLG